MPHFSSIYKVYNNPGDHSLLASMKKYLPIVLIIACGCSKDRAVPAGIDFGGATTPIGPFVPLTTGSFWVYNYYLLDTNGMETYQSSDTLRILSDTIINGKTYAVFNGSYENKCSNCIYFRRDSLGYLIDETGRIYFSDTNFTDTLVNLSNTTLLLFYKMAHRDSVISVPAGTFRTYDYKRTIDFYSDPRPPQHCHYFYSAGAGVVKAQWKYSAYFIYNVNVTRLISYYIAP